MPYINDSRLRSIAKRLFFINARARYYHFLKVRRDKRFSRTLGQLCQYAGLDPQTFTPQVRALLDKKVLEVSTVQAHFVSGSIVVQMYDDTDEQMRWAMRHGALVVVTTRQIDQLPCIVVDFPPLVFGKMCQYFRELRDISVTAVTGSIGKTTVKRMVNAVYSAQHPTFCASVNYNTLYQMGYFVQHIPQNMPLMVQEVSESDPGYMVPMAATLLPRIAIITKIDISHFETFGSQEGIVEEACKITSDMRGDSHAIVNIDDFTRFDLLHSQHVTTISESNPDADFHAEAIETTSKGLSFDVVEKGTRQRHRIHLNDIYAPHNIVCALYAYAAGVIENIERANIVKGLELFKMQGIRQNVTYSPDGITLYVDCYNAVPLSVKSAIGAAAAIPIQGKRVAVLGDIAELGALAGSSHEEILQTADHPKFDTLLLYGPQLSTAAATHHFSPHLKVVICNSHEEVAATLRDILHEGDLVLFKASHSSHLEECIKLMWPSTYQRLMKEEDSDYYEWIKMVRRS